MLETRINLAVALPAEAKPINRLFGLQRLQPVGRLPIYTGQHIAMVVTGHGLLQMESGTGYLQQINANKKASWINIGIAGHADLPLGSALIASTVIGDVSGRTWSMEPPEGLPCASGCVQTVPRLLSDYPGPCALDMEADGFVVAASRFAATEQIQVLKIISDNQQNPAKGISARIASALVEQQYALLRQLIGRMADEYG